MTVSRSIVGMRFAQFHADEIELAVPDSTFGNDGLGELPHLDDRAFQQDRFDALLVIQVRMGGCNGQLMVGMLDARQPLGQFSFVMFVDVR